MRYGSICSGIEAATVAWEGLGWRPAFFSEIDPFCSRLLAQRYPRVPNYGDFTQLLSPTHPVHAAERLDVLVGGTPCQDFSIAGLRAGVGGARGSLTLDFCRLVDVLRPRWVVWENVPGVLSSDGGRAMGAFTGALAELGYGFAWRVLDAQYFGLAQRRKRVFVVGHAGGEPGRPGTVLLEPEGVRRDPPTRKQARKEVPVDAGGRTSERGGAVAFGCDLSQKAEGIAFSEEFQPCIAGHHHHAGHGSHVLTKPRSLVPQAITMGEVAGPLDANYGKGQGSRQGGEREFMAQAIAPDFSVRRLTPRECERLQGFPDDYTVAPDAKGKTNDSSRYRALGNSMAVPVMRWIGARIAIVDAFDQGEAP